MINLVEIMCDEDEIVDAPCAHGQIVVNHACYCHRDDWPNGPRKCPIYRSFHLDLTKWHRRDWEMIEVPVYSPDRNPPTHMEFLPFMPDDDIGGCPMFEPPPEKDDDN